MRNLTGIPTGNWTGQRILRHGAGFVVQFSIALDGTIAIGCDDFGCYFKRPTDSEFLPILAVSQMPAGDVPARLEIDGNFSDTPGCYAIAIAPNNSDRVYFCYNGLLYKFTVSTKTAVRCGFTQQKLTPNSGTQRTWARKLSVDNQNANAFILGTQFQVYYSTNGGTTVTSLSAPACDTDTGNGASGGPYPYPHLVDIDPTSPVASGVRQRCYYSVYSTGVNGGIYESTTGPGGPYTLISGSPKDCQFMRFGPSGKMWVCDNTGNIWWYSKTAGVFTKLTTPPHTGYVSVAEDPANAAHIIAMDGGSNLIQSFDTAATWQDWSRANQLTMATTQAYLQTQGPSDNYIESTAGIEFNPASTNELWHNFGFGVSKCTPPATLGAAPLRWYEQNKGIDQANCTDLVCLPDGALVATFLDVGPWRIDDFTRCNNRPNAPFKSTDTWDMRPPFIVQPSHAVDYAANNPNYVAVVTCNGWYGFQPGISGTVSNPTTTPGDVFSITVNGVTTNVTLTGTTLTSTIADINTANAYGIIPSSAGTNQLQLLSTANYPFTMANVTGTPLTALGLPTTVNNQFGPGGNPHNGFSLDGWKTSTPFATNIAGEPSWGGNNLSGGQIAVGQQGDIIVVWAAHRRPRYTEDGGLTWNICPWPGVPSVDSAAGGPDNGVGDWSNGNFYKKGICYDKTGGNFYFYNYGPGSDPTLAGIYKMSRPHVVPTKIYNGSFTNGSFNVRLRPVPGRAGEMFFTAGMKDDPSAPSSLYRCVDNFDGTMTVTVIPNTTFINDIAFSPFGGSYPAILVFGIISGVGGYHISYDNCATWTNLGYLGDWADWPNVLYGNPNKLEFYAGLYGTGVMRISYSYPLTIQ